MARLGEGETKPRWPWTEAAVVASAAGGQTGSPQAVGEQLGVALAPKPRRFRWGARHVPEPDGVTWLGESQVVKALEEAEAREWRKRRPADTLPEPAVAADPGEPTTSVPPVAEADSGAAEVEPAAPAGVVTATSGRGPNPFRRKKGLRGPSPMEAEGEAAAAASVELPGSQEHVVTDTATQEQAVAEGDPGLPRRRINWLGTKQVAAIVAVVLAAEVGYIVHLNMSSASDKAAPPRALPALSVPPQSTLPSASLPVTTPTTAAAPATKAASAPATTVPAHTSAGVVPVTAATPPPQPCTAGDLSFSTTTNQTSYSSGQPVVIVSKVTDVTSCVFTPSSSSGSSCPTSISVDYANGGAAPMGSESCTPPAASTMNPGATETVTATLPPGELAPGSYTAVGTWGWRSGQGTLTATPASGTFTIS